MKKKTKHPKDMTGDEVMAHVFHPKALKHINRSLRDSLPVRHFISPFQLFIPIHSVRPY